jgi:BASS family bile acid:Na+ symporter
VLDVVKIILAIALPAMMLAEGLRVEARPLQLAYLLARPWLLARSVLAVDVAVPVIALLVTLLLRPEPPVAVGLAILAASPIAPFIIGRARKSGADSAYIASMHMTLAVISIVTTPLALAILGSLLHFEAKIRPLTIAGQVVRSLVLPFGLGVAARTWTPRFADRAVKPLSIAAGAMLLAAATAILIGTGRFLLLLNLRSYLAMVVMLLAALAVGEVFAGGARPQRMALALETAARNPGLALLIASLNFNARAALPVLIPYLIVSAVIIAVYSARRRQVAVA